MHRVPAKLGRAIATLLVAVLMMMPVIDAFMCSFESEAEHAAIALDESATPSAGDEAGKGDAPEDRAHGVCMHNHCHHSTANLFFSASVNHDAARVVQSAPQDATPAFGVYEQLLRPPRS